MVLPCVLPMSARFSSFQFLPSFCYIKRLVPRKSNCIFFDLLLANSSRPSKGKTMLALLGTKLLLLAVLLLGSSIHRSDANPVSGNSYPKSA